MSAGRAVMAGLACLLVAASPARAATVEVVAETTATGGTVWFSTYVANPGEVNDVTVVPRGEQLVFSDAAAPLVAGRGCRREDEHTATCERPFARVFTSDMDDRARLPSGLVHGGEGNDVLIGGGAHGTTVFGEEGDDWLFGGPGGDRIDGGPGNDRSFGGAGDDQFDDRAPFDPAAAPEHVDHVDGGPGLDRVNYSRGDPTTLDLHARRGAQEGDELVNVEGGFLSMGGLFVGDAAGNHFHSLDPAVLLGGAGPDRLDADSEERDVLDGGSGDDALNLTDAFFDDTPARDRLRCGPGRDDVGDPAPNTLIPVDCERATFLESSSPYLELPGSRPRGVLATVLWSGLCDDEDSERCGVSTRVDAVRATDGSRRARPVRLLGRARGAVTRRRPRVPVAPNGAGRRLLASGRCFTARVLTRFGEEGEHEVLFRLGRDCRPPAPFRP